MSNQIGPRRLATDQTCEVWTTNVTDGTREQRLASRSTLLEAPNRSFDGEALVPSVNNWSPGSESSAYVAYPSGTQDAP